MVVEMAYISWDNNFLTHIHVIDEQHKKLLKLINDLHEKLRAAQGIKVIRPIITSLFEYVTVHFATEEKYMIKYDYPEFEAHSREHNEFHVKVQEFDKKHKIGSILLAREVLLFLGTWYRNHILTIDKKMGQYLQNKGVI